MISLNIQVDGSSRKPKRPKVYAIRTFPEGCGVHPPRMNLKENEKENLAVMAINNHQVDGFSRKPKRPKVSAIRTFPQGCGGQGSKMNVKENGKENSAVMAINNHRVDEVSRKPENQKVYAISTFPEVCGAQASRINLKGNEKEKSAIIAINNHHVEEKKWDRINTSSSPCSSIIENRVVKKSPPSSILKDLLPLQVNDLSRQRVKYALSLFQEMLLEDFEVVVYNGSRSRVDMMIAKFLKMKQKWINTSQRLGDIPGVLVGDVFEWMAELNVIGLHHQFQNGIDYMKRNGITLATSIVASGRYANVVESSDVLIYSGHGGNPSMRANHQPRDQKLERGNLALKNSMEAKTPVRVIRGFKLSKSSNLTSTSCKNTIYLYDGLYYVHDSWLEKGKFGKLVFMFLLKRILGQPKLQWPKTIEEIIMLKG
ncbi:hypothetical protein ACOSQ4_017021 [Xanthoceras sorbifolium]